MNIIEFLSRYKKTIGIVFACVFAVVLGGFVGVVGEEHKEWVHQHCKRTGSRVVEPVMVFTGDVPLTSGGISVHYEYACDNGTMEWLEE